MKQAVLVSWLALAVVSITGLGQEPSAPPSSTGETLRAPHGQVVYQRSDSDAAPQSEKHARKSGSDSMVKSEITDADRLAPTFTDYALDVRLQPEQHAIAVRAQFTVRNDGDHALKQLPLQLSSTLHWEEISVTRPARVRCRFLESPLDSDTDHTGGLNEAAVVLPQPLAPGESLALDAIYSGQIPMSAQRLQTLGTPANMAAHSDWDRVAPEFIGLRGFGNVAWYPVSSVPVRLGDGDKLFEEIGRVKLRQADATVSIRVTDEARSNVPDVAILNGTVVPIAVAPGTEQTNVPSLATSSLPEAPLGFQPLSLFLAERQHKRGNEVDIYARPEEGESVAAYLSAAETVTPLMKIWLGDQPKHTLSILDLPAIDDAPFEERQTLFTGLQPVTADQLTATLSHSLSHAYFISQRPWLNEGVAQFMSTLWTEQSKTRDAAIVQLNTQRAALALAEPVDGASLLNTSDAIFYRTKATYVLWMLRSMIGDDAMQALLKAYDPAADTTDNYFEKLTTKFAASYTNNDKSSSSGQKPKELHWFFDDWVYHDKGLPDLSITGIYPSKASAPDSYLVAVNVSNTGGAGADVPVTVTSGTTQVTERMLVPAHGTASRRILIQDEPVQVQVNDGVVPELEASEHVQRIHYTQPMTP